MGLDQAPLNNQHVFGCPQVETEFLDKVAQDLGTSRHVLFGKMLAVKMLIADDAQLLEALDSLKMLIKNKS